MKKCVVGFIAALMLVPAKGTTAVSREMNRRLDALHIPFIANNGQLDRRVKFYAKMFSGTT